LTAAPVCSLFAAGCSHWAGDINRQWWAVGAQQQQHNTQQYRTNCATFTAAEHTLVGYALARDVLLN